VTAGPLAVSVIRQSLLPMLVFYLILMVVLGLGLRALLRQGAAPTRPDATSAPAAGPPGGRREWLAWARYVLVTVICGYLVLLAVAVGYYYAIARVGGAFLYSVATGPALLLALALPVFAVASWIYERVRARRGKPADRVRSDSPNPPA
jgi:predicted secreted protein